MLELDGWDEPEWGFQRCRNTKENDFDCSREFEEETWYESKYLTMIKNVGYFEETFTGSNMSHIDISIIYVKQILNILKMNHFIKKVKLVILNGWHMKNV